MLHTARATRGMVTSSHRLAAEAGLRVLREGGNAVEAMVAAASTVSVVYPHMNGIGGDGFWLISTPAARAPAAIMGVGAAGRNADADFYAAKGLDAIPSRGPLAANTVAGTVSSWDAALRLAGEMGGRLPLGRLLEDAIWYAENGVPVTRLHCENVAAKAAEMTNVPGWNELFLADGEPSPGDILKQPALADTLKALAVDGLDNFYRGPLARIIAADLERAGSPVTLEDLNGHGLWQGAPLSVPISGATLYNCPPPTQGLVSLLILALFDRLDRPADATGFDYVHRMVECFKQAALIRDAEITDPAYMRKDPAALMDSAFLDKLAKKVDRARALPWPQPAAPGDTVWLGAVDAAGNAVSFIHSIYWEFGSGTVLEDTGIQWQNRGSSFSLDRDALNALIPGRKPFHTNNPAMAVFEDGRVMPYGSMGGEGQPQTQSAIFSRYAWYGMELQAAITAPRWLLGRTWGTPKIELTLESRFGPETVGALEAAGHTVNVLGEYDPLLGHAGALVLHPGGLIEGASDPRSDGAAAGF